ncbi:MAG: TetR/AcrR family transcriptional regulator [Propionicimonas sp.]
MASAGLDQTRVVEEAEHIADEVGLHRLTLTLLAARVGVRQPSLYKHIDGLPGLHRRIRIRGKLELADVLARAAVGRSRGDALVAMAHAYRRWAREHPGRYEAAQSAPTPADVEDQVASRAVVGVLAEVLTGYNLTGDDAIDAIRFVRAALHGFVSLEAPGAGAFALPVDVDRSFDRLVQAVVTALNDWDHS